MKDSRSIMCMLACCINPCSICSLISIFIKLSEKWLRVRSDLPKSPKWLCKWFQMNCCYWQSRLEGLWSRDSNCSWVPAVSARNCEKQNLVFCVSELLIWTPSMDNIFNITYIESGHSHWKGLSSWKTKIRQRKFDVNSPVVGAIRG